MNEPDWKKQFSGLSHLELLEIAYALVVELDERSLHYPALLLQGAGRALSTRCGRTSTEARS